jgi:hypothetical protein
MNHVGLLDVPFYDPMVHGYWVFWIWKYKHNNIPIIQQQVDRVSKWLGREVLIQRDHVPVVFKDMDVPKVDVALNTMIGVHAPYKMWPYFNELKAKMDKFGIRHYDLDGSGTYGIECLNVVKRAQLYVGLDTGMAHYVSRFANGKALIINGGFVSFDFWASLYDYEPIQIDDVSCRPCYRSRVEMGCEYGNRCMREITVDMVLDRICERLGK